MGGVLRDSEALSGYRYRRPGREAVLTRNHRTRRPRRPCTRPMNLDSPALGVRRRRRETAQPLLDSIVETWSQRRPHRLVSSSILLIRSAWHSLHFQNCERLLRIACGEVQGLSKITGRPTCDSACLLRKLNNAVAGSETRLAGSSSKRRFCLDCGFRAILGAVR